jgi:hypothetical protein
MKETRRDAMQDYGHRPGRLLEDVEIPAGTERGEQVLRNERLGAEEVEVAGAPVTEVKRQRGAAREIKGPDLDDPAQ